MKIYGDCIAGSWLIVGVEFIFRRKAELLVKQIHCIQNDISEFSPGFICFFRLIHPKTMNAGALVLYRLIWAISTSLFKRIVAAMMSPNIDFPAFSRPSFSLFCIQGSR